MKQTTRSLVTTLALLVVAAGIGGAALWANRSAEKETQKKENAAKIFDVDAAKVRSVRLTREGKLVAVATRADEKAQWKIVEPVQADTEATVVDSVVTGVADLRQKSDLGEVDGKQYGFESPKIVVSLKTDDGKEHALELGDMNPFDNTQYARKGGEKIVRVLDGYAKNPFDKQLFDVREKRIAHLDDSAEIRRIEVTGVFPPYTVEKDGNNWKLVAPAPGLADTSTVDRIGGALRALRATAVAVENPDAASLKRSALSPPKITATLTVATAGGKESFRRTLLIGQPAPTKGTVAVKTYAKRDDSPTVYEVDGQIVKDLQKDMFELQDKMLVHANREDVRKIVFEQSGTPNIVVQRTKDQTPDAGFAEENFSILEPKQGAAKKWRVSSTLYSIVGLRAAAFGPKIEAKAEPKYGFSRTVKLVGDGDKVLARIRIGNLTPDGKRRYVASDGEARIAEVEKAAVDDLPKTVDEMLEAPAATPGADGGTPLQAANPKK
jgi:Domain of unknown function (DUF4340)